MTLARVILAFEGSETGFPNTPTTVGTTLVCRRSSDGPDDSWRRVTAYDHGEVASTLTLIPIARIASGPRVICLAYVDGRPMLWAPWAASLIRYETIVDARAFLAGGGAIPTALRAAIPARWKRFRAGEETESTDPVDMRFRVRMGTPTGALRAAVKLGLTRGDQYDSDPDSDADQE